MDKMIDCSPTDRLRIKAGSRVMIRTQEAMANEFSQSSDGHIRTPGAQFTTWMKYLCGHEYTVVSTKFQKSENFSDGERIVLEPIGDQPLTDDWCITRAMLCPVENCIDPINENDIFKFIVDRSET